MKVAVKFYCSGCGQKRDSCCCAIHNHVLDQLMPGFDLEIGKLAQRVLINPRRIDYQTRVFANKITPAKDEKPVIIELIDAKTEIL